MPEKDWGIPAKPIPERDTMGFGDEFPTATRGDGKLRQNNVKTGAAQGKGSSKLKVRCRQCGMLVNLNTVDHSGGSLDGSGAGGTITQVSDTGTMLNGNSYTDTHGEQALKKGAGCPHCFSKNSTSIRNLVQTPTPKPLIGF